MQLCHAVYGMAADDGEIGHADTAAPKDGGACQKLLPVFLISGEGFPIASVDLFDEIVYTRKKPLHHGDGPGLHRLRKHRMIRIRDRSRHRCPGRIPVTALLVNQDPQKLRRAECRMGIVGMDGDMIREMDPIRTLFLLVILHDIGQSRCHKHVFLL